MKNLKRVLSLALATVMLLGVMVVGSNAAFSDQSSIKYDESVDFMVGLGVISGVGQNQFQPNGTLTRAQAAQLVAMVKAGANKNTIAYYDGNTKFTDVGANHNWAKAAINYCVANGIIAGQTANTYAPDAPLTGVALAKMMLVALGYPATSEKDTETLVGPNWQVNTLRKATAAGLFKDLDSSFVAVKNITREEAAQMMFNALYSDVVEAKTWDMYGNPQYQVQVGKKLITTCFDMVEVKGIVTGNAATGKKGTMLTDITFPNGGGSDSKLTTSSTYALETGLDMIGHDATILVKTDKKGEAVLDADQNVVTYGIVDNATLATSFVTSDKGLEEDLKAAGFSKNAAGSYKNDVSVDSNYQIGTAASLADKTKGKQIVAVSNSNDMTVDYIILVESYLNKVTTVKTTGTGKDAVTTYSFKETAGFGATSKTNDKVNVYEGIAKDDYVIVTKTAADFYNVEKVNAVSSNVNRLNKSGNVLLSVVAGGTTYGPSGVDTTAMATSANKVTAFTGTTTGECILLLDGEGKLIATAEGAASVSFAYVAAVAPESGYDENNMLVNDMPKAMVYFADGTKGAYFVDTTKSDTNGNATDEGAEFVEGFKGVYNVVLGADNKVVITKAAGTTETTSAWAIKKGVSKVDGASNIYTNSDTVVFFVNGEYGKPGFSVTVQTGTANISAVAASKIATAQVGEAVAGNKFVSAMLVNEAPSDGKVEVLYYNGVFSVEQNGSNFTTHYTVYKDGVETTVSYEKVNKDNAVTTPGFCTSGGTNLNMIDSTDEGTNKVKTGATPTAFVGGTLTAGDDYQVTDSTVVLNLVPETTLSLEDILNGDVVITADSRIAVSYTEDPVTHVKTATAVYITAATLKPTTTPTTPPTDGGTTTPGTGEGNGTTTN